MSWNCPECSKQNDDVKCSCGYAYFRVLGVKPEASKAEVKKTYQYLLNVWQETAHSHDAASRKRAEDRLAKINAAIEVYHHLSSPATKANRPSLPMIAIPAAALVAITIAVLLFWKSGGKEPMNTPQQQASQGSAPQTQPAPEASPQPQPQPQPEQQARLQQPAQETTGPVAVTGDPEDAALEAVKKSKVLDRFFTVEALMKKWTDDNEGKLQFSGWKVRKINDQTYLIAYTATDGMTTRGFYFDVDLATGTVRDLVKFPDIRKEYGL